MKFLEIIHLFHWVFINSKPYFGTEDTAVGRKEKKTGQRGGS